MARRRNFQKNFVLLLGLVFLQSSIFSPAAFSKELPDFRYYLVPAKIFQLLNSEQKKRKIRSEQNLSLVKLSIDEIEELSINVHQKYHTCGGFIDVNDQVANGTVAGFDIQKFLAGSHQVAVFRRRPVRFAKASRYLINYLDANRFESTLRQLVQFPDRSARTENGKQAALWLKDKALKAAQAAGRADVKVRMIPTGGRYIQDSVVVKIPGATSKPGVLVGGHMDTFRRNKPGADDDGTGVITGLEILRAILDSKVRFKRDIYIAFYAAEEVGLVGSGVVARTFKSEGIALQAVLQFDMTGYRSPRDSQDFYFVEDYVNPAATEFAREVAIKVLGLPREKVGRTKCNYACSDHASWHRLGYAAVFPFETSFRNSNRAIHTSRDTMAKLDMEHAMKYVRLGLAFMTEIAEPIAPKTIVPRK